MAGRCRFNHWLICVFHSVTTTVTFSRHKYDVPSIQRFGTRTSRIAVKTGYTQMHNARRILNTISLPVVGLQVASGLPCNILVSHHVSCNNHFSADQSLATQWRLIAATVRHFALTLTRFVDRIFTML